MKMIITALNDNLEAQVDPRFGRAAYFILYNTEDGEFTVHSNQQNLNAAQGAGIQAAQIVARLKPELVITGHVGPKAFATLNAARIKVYTGATGTVKESVDLFADGKLRQADQADVEGHWV